MSTVYTPEFKTLLQNVARRVQEPKPACEGDYYEKNPDLNMVFSHDGKVIYCGVYPEMPAEVKFRLPEGEDTQLPVLAHVKFDADGSILEGHHYLTVSGIVIRMATYPSDDPDRIMDNSEIIDLAERIR